MVTVTVLLQGYYRPKPVKVCSTVTLVQDNNTNIIIDPGSVKNIGLLHNSLKKNRLSADDIHCVCITHSHLDHYKNIALFQNAYVIDYWGKWKNDSFTETASNGKITENVSVLATPGHSYDSISIIIQTETEIVAVCGDVFWHKNAPKHDLLAQNQEILNKSRKLLMNKADLIIPGHGAPFNTH